MNASCHECKEALHHRAWAYRHTVHTHSCVTFYLMRIVCSWICDLSACPHVWPCVSVYFMWSFPSACVCVCVCVYISLEKPAECQTRSRKPSAKLFRWEAPNTQQTPQTSHNAHHPSRLSAGPPDTSSPVYSIFLYNHRRLPKASLSFQKLCGRTFICHIRIIRKRIFTVVDILRTLLNFTFT